MIGVPLLATKIMTAPLMECSKMGEVATTPPLDLPEVYGRSWDRDIWRSLVVPSAEHGDCNGVLGLSMGTD